MNEVSTRREFLQQMSLGSALLAGGNSTEQTSPPNSDQPRYPSLASFQNHQGGYLLRVSVQCNYALSTGISGSIHSEGARIRRAKNYFSPVGQLAVQDNRMAWEMSGHTAQPYVLVVWLTPSQEAPQLTLDIGRNLSFSLSELFEQSGVAYATDSLKVSVGLLGTQEIGTVEASFFNLPPAAENFTFAIMADPQGGDPHDPSNGSLTRMKIHNAFVENSVTLVSLLKNPAFCLVLGDIVDSQGQATNFNRMLTYFKRVDIPWLFSVGNHETKYQLTFGPGYDLSGFANYFAAQESINGLNKLLYSFNLGRWHFIVWPDPLRSNFWQTHPHYFDWLEQDLEEHKDRPTFFFQHVPVHPIGIDPLISYVESVDVKRLLLDILARHGNVKYVLSGHVHIPMRASLKTAVSYRGMQLINLPAAGYRPRAFGEEDTTGGPVQGIAVVHIEAEQARIDYHTVTDEVYHYPSSFRSFSADQYPLWLGHKWELDAPKQLVNGDFSAGLIGWHPRYVYLEDQAPSNVCEVRTLNGKPALYLFSACRGYRVPGQDRLPQTIHRYCQAISVTPGQLPVLSFQYQVEEENFYPDHWAGAFVWVEGFERDEKKLDHVYTIGKAYGNLRDQHLGIHRVPTAYWDLEVSPGSLQHARLNIRQDYEKAQGPNDTQLSVDRLVVNLGVWTANEHPGQRLGVYFSNFMSDQEDASSSVDGVPLPETSSHNLWRKAIDHIAGEHIHVDEKYVPPARS